MKKKLLLFVACLLLTGCTTEVTLNIDSEKVTETIKVFGLKSEVYQNNQLDENIKFNLNIFEREYEFYDMNEFEDNDYVGKTYKLSEKLKLWSELTHINACYERFELEKTDTNIILNTSEEYRCGYLYGANSVTVIVESDLELVSSNADKIDGKKLIWNINEDNYQNRAINFNYQIVSTSDEKSIKNYAIYIAFGVVSLIFILYVFIRVKNKENNKI